MPIPLVAEQDFEREVLRNETPVLVDLYADWCQPCKALEPILDQVAAELAGKLKIIRIDIEQSPGLAQAFRVQSIPMMVLFVGGRPADQVVGLVDKNRILAMVEPHLPRQANELAAPELAQLVTQGRAVPVDIRDAGSFARYHIPGAIHVPAEEALTRTPDLIPSDGRIRVLYARGGDEAKELSEKLLAAGVQVGFLAGGFLGWEAEGLEVERG
ncbi:MAG: thioredoxin domain-containing protein [Myxococcales bacterium]|nr:thioredoxin domain-containing protein [Myxococcales bacterium]